MMRPFVKKPYMRQILKGNEDDERVFELEFQHLFEGEYREDPIYKVQIVNNLRQEPGFFFNTVPTCEYCGNDHKDNCDFSFTNRNITLKDILSQ